MGGDDTTWTTWSLRTILTTVAGISCTGLVTVVSLLWNLNQQVGSLNTRLDQKDREDIRRDQEQQREIESLRYEVSVVKSEALRLTDLKRFELVVLNSFQNKKGNELVANLVAYIRSEIDIREKQKQTQ